MFSESKNTVWHSRQVKLGLAMVSAVVVSILLTPRLPDSNETFVLEEVIPKHFGDWTETKLPYVQVDVQTKVVDDTSINQPYDQKLMRTYENSRGKRIMLALAWGRNQRQEVKVHRPELCYAAQGFQIVSQEEVKLHEITGSSGPIVAKRLLAMSATGAEAVVYWIRIGSLYTQSAWDTRVHILKEGLLGRISDGILVRASSSIESVEQAAQIYPVIEDFLRDALMAISPPSRYLLVR